MENATTKYSDPLVSRSRRSVQFCPVWFERHGRMVNAVALDLSPGGAKLTAVDKVPEALLEADYVLSMTIWTPYGVSSFRASVRWVRRRNNECCWGVRFEELDESDMDPLKRMIRELCALAI